MRREIGMPFLVPSVFGNTENKHMLTEHIMVQNIRMSTPTPTPRRGWKRHASSQVKVVSSNNDGVGHFGGVHNPRQDTSTNRNVTGEGALLVDVCPIDGLCKNERPSLRSCEQITIAHPLGF